MNRQTTKIAQWDSKRGKYRLIPPFTSDYHYVPYVSADAAIALGYKLCPTPGLHSVREAHDVTPS